MLTYNLCKHWVCEQMVGGQRGTLPFPGILFCLERSLVWGLRMWVECQLVHTVRRHSATSAASSANHHREEVPALFLLRSSGQLVPGQLHGCRVAGKEPILGKPRRAFCICSAVEPPTPTPSPSPCAPLPAPLHSISWDQQERQLVGAAGEERGGWGCVCVRVLSGVGVAATDDITAKEMHSNTCTQWRAGRHCFEPDHWLQLCGVSIKRVYWC